MLTSVHSVRREEMLQIHTRRSQKPAETVRWPGRGVGKQGGGGGRGGKEEMKSLLRTDHNDDHFLPHASLTALCRQDDAPQSWSRRRPHPQT